MHQNHKQNYRDRSRSIEKTEKNRNCSDLPTLKKKCCRESKIQHSLKEVHDYRQTNNIRLRSKSGAVPNPIMSHDDLDDYPSLLKKSLNQSGFKGPTVIQSMAWPIILNGHDMIGIAQTGSGKTLAYLLPGLIHVIEQQSNGVQMLVLAPTRELTIQIFNQFNQYSNSLKAACLYGGQEKYIQRNQLRQNPQLIIACPGRLLDFCNSGDVSLSTVGFWVLDEADMMLDMGFEPQVRQIEQQIRKDRQTILLSATWPKSIEKLALQFCIEEPIQLVIGNQELTVNLSIRQEIIVLQQRDKQRCLKNILQDLSREKCIIFGAKKVEIENIAQFVKSCGLSARAIHGDKVQKERAEILQQFKDDRFTVLVATDVASRGLDIRNVKYVINYDMPKHIEDYIHRIGRTARAGAEGTAISLFSMETDSKLVPELSKLLKEAQQDIPREFRSRF